MDMPRTVADRLSAFNSSLRRVYDTCSQRVQLQRNALEEAEALRHQLYLQHWAYEQKINELSPLFEPMVASVSRPDLPALDRFSHSYSSPPKPAPGEGRRAAPDGQDAEDVSDSDEGARRVRVNDGGILMFKTDDESSDDDDDDDEHHHHDADTVITRRRAVVDAEDRREAPDADRPLPGSQMRHNGLHERLVKHQHNTDNSDSDGENRTPPQRQCNMRASPGQQLLANHPRQPDEAEQGPHEADGDNNTWQGERQEEVQEKEMYDSGLSETSKSEDHDNIGDCNDNSNQPQTIIVRYIDIVEEPPSVIQLEERDHRQPSCAPLMRLEQMESSAVSLSNRVVEEKNAAEDESTDILNRSIGNETMEQLQDIEKLIYDNAVGIQPRMTGKEDESTVETSDHRPMPSSSTFCCGPVAVVDATTAPADGLHLNLSEVGLETTVTNLGAFVEPFHMQEGPLDIPPELASCNSHERSPAMHFTETPSAYGRPERASLNHREINWKDADCQTEETTAAASAAAAAAAARTLQHDESCPARTTQAQALIPPADDEEPLVMVVVSVYEGTSHSHASISVQAKVTQPKSSPRQPSYHHWDG